MRFKLKEKDAYKHIYVDKENKVHILIPLRPAENNIGRDNTCAGTTIISGFSNQCAASLLQYIADLEGDIALLPQDNPMAKAKQARLTQLQHYSKLFRVRAFSGTGDGHAYSDAILSMFAPNNDVNCSIMYLRPAIMDSMFSIPTNRPTIAFTLDRNADNHSSFGQRLNGVALLDYCAPNRVACTVIAGIKRLYNRGHVSSQQDLDDVLKAIRETFAAHGFLQAENMKFQYNSGNSAEDFNYQNLCSIVDVSRQEGLHIDIALLNLLQAESIHWRHLLLETNRSVFGGVLPEYLFNRYAKGQYNRDISILIQFFFGVASLDYCEHQNIQEDVGRRIEAFNGAILVQLIDSIKAALGTDSPEDALLDIFAREAAPLVDRPEYFRNAQNRERIKTIFREQYLTILGSQHYDDFLRFMPDRPGKFVLFRGNICAHYADYVHAVGNGNSAMYDDYFTNNTGAASRLSAPNVTTRAGFASDISQGVTGVDKEAQVGACTIAQILDKEAECIAKFLAAGSADYPGKKVFERLSAAERQQMKSHSKWSQVVGNQAVTALSSSERDKFTFCFAEQQVVLITIEMEKALHESYGEANSFDLLHGQNRKQKLHTILASTIFLDPDAQIMPYQIMDGDNGQLVVAFTAAQNALRQSLETQLPRIRNNSQIQMLLTKDMVGSIYASAGIQADTEVNVNNLIVALQQILPGKQILSAANASVQAALVVTANPRQNGFTLSCTDQSTITEVRNAIEMQYQAYCRHCFSQQEIRWIIEEARGYNRTIANDISDIAIKTAFEVLGVEIIGNVNTTQDGQYEISVPSHSMRKVYQILLPEHLRVLRPRVRALEDTYLKEISRYSLEKPELIKKCFRDEINGIMAYYAAKLAEFEPYFIGYQEDDTQAHTNLWRQIIFTSQQVREFNNERRTAINELLDRLSRIEARVAQCKSDSTGLITLLESEGVVASVISPLFPGSAFPPILKPILLSAAVGFGCTALAMGIVVPSILGLTGPIEPIYATMIGGVILSIGMGILYSSNEQDVGGSIFVFAIFGLLGHTVFIPCIGSGLFELTPYLTGTGLAPEMVTGILIGGTFGITVICDMLAYTLLKQNDVQLFA